MAEWPSVTLRNTLNAIILVKRNQFSRNKILSTKGINCNHIPFTGLKNSKWRLQNGELNFYKPGFDWFFVCPSLSFNRRKKILTDLNF